MEDYACQLVNQKYASKGRNKLMEVEWMYPRV